MTTTTRTTTVTIDAFTPSLPRGMATTQRSSWMVMKEQEGKGGGFNLGNLFGGNKEEGGAAGGGATSTLRGSIKGGSKLEPHPSVRKHISPLNRLGPDPQVEPKAEPLPIHPDVRSGTLPNGLPYIILPNKSPPGRFEAHLQVFSGSADELEPQQGIAHLTEHVAYMGSRKRELLFGTGSQTNGKTIISSKYSFFFHVEDVRLTCHSLSLSPLQLTLIFIILSFTRFAPSTPHEAESRCYPWPWMLSLMSWRHE